MELILKYFPHLTDAQVTQFMALGNLYKNWNAKINVISRKDIEDLYLKHVLHSLAIAKVIDFKPNTKVLDVGTGGGFPGIPLAILFPEADFFLIDSIGKKITVVNEVANSIGLENVSAKQIRAEQIDQKFHFVISRAVTQMPKFVRWVKGKFSSEEFNILPNGILALKGGDLTDELSSFPNIKTYFISDFFGEDFFETKQVVYFDCKNLI